MFQVILGVFSGLQGPSRGLRGVQGNFKIFSDVSSDFCSVSWAQRISRSSQTRYRGISEGHRRYQVPEASSVTRGVSGKLPESL